jgi:hypothetical protein
MLSFTNSFNVSGLYPQGLIPETIAPNGNPVLTAQQNMLFLFSANVCLAE